MTYLISQIRSFIVLYSGYYIQTRKPKGKKKLVLVMLWIAGKKNADNGLIVESFQITWFTLRFYFCVCIIIVILLQKLSVR